MRLVEWRPLHRNSLRGFVVVELPMIGLTIADIAVCMAHGRPWASLPTKPMLNSDGAAMRDSTGKIRYSPILRWRDRALGDRWSDAVVALVRAAHPGALDDGGAP
jgi:hypothetical protein